MKKPCLLLFVLCLELSLMPGPVVAGDGFAPNDNEINSAIGLQGWFTQAEAKWQISFPYTTHYTNPGIPAGTSGRSESELTFKKIDSPVFIATGGTKINELLSFDVVYGTGTIHNGGGTDTDRFIPDNGQELEFSQSTNDVTGEVKIWGVDLYLNNKRYTGTQSGPWGGVVGFFHYEDSLRMTNAVQTVSVPFEGLTFPNVGPFPPDQVLDQTYDFSWNMLKVGVLRQAEFTKGFSYVAAFSIYPYVDYRGEGYWNLRAGRGPGSFRMQSPNFVQTSTTGYGYDASLGLAYEVTENFELSAGYRFLYLYAYNGTDTTYFADGSTYQDNVDWITVTRQGAYAEMTVKF